MKLTYNTYLQPINNSNLELDNYRYSSEGRLVTQISKFKFRTPENMKPLTNVSDFTDISEVFSALNQNSQSEEFKKIQYKIKKAEKISNKQFQCITVFEDKKEVICVQFVNNILKLVQIEDFNNTSVLTTKEDVESLFYFIIKNEFKLTDQTVYELKIEDVLKLNSGFVGVKTLRKDIGIKLLNTEKDLIYTPNKVTIESDFRFKVDNRDLYSYTTFPREFVKLSYYNDFQPLEKLNYDLIEGNIILIYSFDFIDFSCLGATNTSSCINLSDEGLYDIYIEDLVAPKYINVTPQQISEIIHPDFTASICEESSFLELSNRVPILINSKDRSLYQLKPERLLLSSELNTFGFNNNENLTTLEEIHTEYKKRYFFKNFKSTITINNTNSTVIHNNELLEEIERIRDIISSRVVIL